MKLFLCIFIVLSFSLTCLAQSSFRTETQGENFRLDLSKPSAFISFEKFVEKKSPQEGEDNEELWLRFHNNTKWKLFVKAIGEDKEHEVYGILYEVQRIRGMEWKTKDADIPIGRRQVHVGSILEIESGKSILFSVTRKHLADGLSILVSFSYEWEKLGKSGGDLELLHQATFWSTDLPKTKK